MPLTRFYRLARNKPATLADLLSHEALGKTPWKGVRPKRWAAVSMFDTMENALKKRAEIPDLGDFVAILDLPDEVQRERTGKSPGHYSVYETGEALMAYIVETVDVPIGEDAEAVQALDGNGQPEGENAT